MDSPLEILPVVALVASVAFIFWRNRSLKRTTKEEKNGSRFLVFVRIPESLMPDEREEKYEIPLNHALQEANLGEVTGGGTQLGERNPDGSHEIDYVGLDVDLENFPQGLPFLRKQLTRLGAPSSTTLQYELDGKYSTEPL